MEDRNLNEQESLELISRMIRNTRERMEEYTGIHFLIWGYTTVAVSVIIWYMFTFSKADTQVWNWFWLAIPVIGGLVYWLYSRHSHPPRSESYLDRVIFCVWLVLGITGAGVALLALLAVVPIPVLFLIALIMGMGSTITGLIVQFTPLVVAGIAGLALAGLLLVIPGPNQILCFALIFVVLMIVPGHILNYLGRR
ncbi:MAG: hypothetical protein LUF04_07115 [Bacteroides sp.]|nr:hypothetical protein [Bacteroides sp.]